jgi:hypothetical protein
MIFARSTFSSLTGSLAADILEYIGDEITRTCIEISDRPVSDNSMIIYELTNRVYAEKIFLEHFSEMATGRISSISS